MGSEQSCCGKYVCCGRELDSVGLEEFLEQADTGDIVLFNQTTLGSQWKCFSRSEWNHVAIVVNTPKKVKFLVEAVEPEVIAWRLDKAMESWTSPDSSCQRIAWRQISGVNRTKGLVRSFFKFTMAIKRRPFEQHWMELVSAIVRQDVQRCCRPSKRVGKKKHVEENTKPRPTGAQGEQMDESGLETEQNDINAEEEVDMMHDLEEGSERQQTTEALFCSELVAFYYQQAGWMSKDQLPCRFLPKDFADYRSANVPYYLEPQYSLGPMLLVEPSSISKLLPPAVPPTMGRVPYSSQAVQGSVDSSPVHRTFTVQNNEERQKVDQAPTSDLPHTTSPKLHSDDMVARF